MFYDSAVYLVHYMCLCMCTYVCVCLYDSTSYLRKFIHYLTINKAPGEFIYNVIEISHPFRFTTVKKNYFCQQYLTYKRLPGDGVSACLVQLIYLHRNPQNCAY